jgi:hypothetical protein
MPKLAARAKRQSRLAEADAAPVKIALKRAAKALRAPSPALPADEAPMSKAKASSAKRAILAKPASQPVQAMQNELQKAFGPRHKALKRSGMRPLSFDGALMAEASSHTPGTRLWYEINLYRQDAGGYVAEVKLFRKEVEAKDVYRAEAFADVAALAQWLEAHDPANDAVVEGEIADADAPLAVAALSAVKMRQAIDEARREYRYLVGELLYALDVTE